MQNVVRLEVPNHASRQLGRYRLIATLGQGGMGTIHLAVAGGLGGFRKLFVVKELRTDLTRNAQFVEMFMQEARLAACLNHVNVVDTVEADHENGRYFLAMEHLQGQPFNEILRSAEQDPAVPLGLRLQVICHALAGLHYAHELRDYDGRALHVVHRDVSPANIFVTYDGQVKVLDFGIAKAGDTEGSQPGDFKGKVGYAAPEQLRGRPADRRIDVFAAGVVLWEAIALRHFVRGKPSRQVFEARLSGTEPRIRQIVPDLDPALADICDRAMHADPDERYPSAEAFRLALQAYLDGRAMAVDAGAIGRFMRSKFAEQRSALHRTIEAQLRTDGSPETLASALRLAPGTESGRHSGLGSLVSHIPLDAGELLSWQEAERHQRRHKAALQWGGVLLAVAVAAALAWRARPDPESSPEQTPMPAASVTPNPEAVPGMKASDQDPERGDTSVPQAPEQAQARDDAVEGGSGPEARPARWAKRSAAAPAKAAKRSAARRSSRGRPGPKPKRPARGEAPKPAASDTGLQRPGMNIDLRDVQRHGRRQLDLDNPFR